MDENLTHLMKGKTPFIAAPRFATITKADLILMFEKGRIVEQGTDDQPLAKSDQYRRLHEFQRLEPSTYV